MFKRYKIINRRKFLFTALADYIGKTISLPARLLKGRKGAPAYALNDTDVREILVVRTSYLGDVIMTLPILRPLKERFPCSRLTFLTSTVASEVLKSNPYVDEVIVYDPFWFYKTPKRGYFTFISGLKERFFDLVIEARSDIRELLLLVRPLKATYKVSYDVGGGGFLLTDVVPYEGLRHKVLYHLGLVEYLGCRVGNLDWGFYLTLEEKTKALKIINDYKINRPFIALHPGSRLPLKKWPPERYSALCDKIIDEYDMQVVILGSAVDRDSVGSVIRGMKHSVVDLSEALTLRELAGVIGHSEFLLCNDSAPMHVAACEGVSTVAIFGPSKSVETSPFGNVHRVVEKPFPCRFTCDEGTCRNSRLHACMKDISVQDVFDAVKKKYNKQDKE
ncbi:MAG: glycosyltransferase family 9 protein [Nitrospirae bacterium]|nr:glycosyltransferase family 9 protein [Nitrospirota bacterium]